MKGPTPRMPFAPKVATVLFGVPVQAAGGLPAEAAPISCTMTVEASSPEVGICMSAVGSVP